MMAAVRRQAGTTLSDLIPEIDPAIDRDVQAIATDSRGVDPGTLFFARRGLTVDAVTFIDDAVRAGAVAVVREGESGFRLLSGGVPEIGVTNLAAVLGQAAHRFFDEPSSNLRVIGVTGTNGKTSVSHFIGHALRIADGQGGPAAGVIGTLGHGPAGALESGMLTTPDVIDVHRILAEMRSSAIRDVVVEVSSHALSQGRVEGVRFDTAVFTNLTRDHLDFHGSMSAYGASKAKLFHAPGLNHVIINADDEFGRELLKHAAHDLDVFAYSLDVEPGEFPADNVTFIRGRLVDIGAAGLEVEVQSAGQSGRLRVPLIGRFNAQNLLAALGALLAGGVGFDRALDLLRQVPPVPGRMQPFGQTERDPLIVVDYSHTPDALSSALRSLRVHCIGRVWCVFGCGGDRDRGKRSQMGAVAEALADVVVMTDDNPRSEDGDQIIEDITKGFARSTVDHETLFIERDRGVAIRFAVHSAAPGDVVLIAGKGHETYQEIGGVRRPFSDAAAVRNALEGRRA